LACFTHEIDKNRPLFSLNPAIEPCINLNVVSSLDHGVEKQKEIDMLGRILTAAAVAAGGVILSKRLKQQRSGSDALSSVQESIEVEVPISTAYNQWTQFEDFPQFMSTVHEVRQLDDTHMHWRASVAGKEKEWDAEITQQIPDRRIGWRSTSGVRNEGVVTFEPISDSRTRINLRMSYAPETLTEQVGDMFGATKLQAKQNLTKFKEMMESRRQETGAWRGTVTSPQQH
jgi:uncharacterized membrane protein